MDNVFLMGYDYHLPNSKITGPVSPFNDPKQIDIVNSLNILYNYFPKNKIIMGVPFYGRDWPCASDHAGAQTIANASPILIKTAIHDAQVYGRRWDSSSHTPWYAYKDASGTWHQVWYDDSASLELKWNYALQQGLAGTGFWAIGGETPAIWIKLIDMFK